MKFSKISALISGVAVVTVFAASVAWAGTVAVQTGGTNISQTNYLYQSTNFPVSNTFGSTPISSLTYTWRMNRFQSGQQTFLCVNTTSTCVDVSSTIGSSRTGTTTALNGYPANSTFFFAFRVNSGSNTLISPSLYGTTHNLSITVP